jgi:hypothetical protein
MGRRFRILRLVAPVALGCLAFAGAASAADSFGGTVANGGCAAGRGVSVSGPSRIEVSVASTAQNNTEVYAEILTSGGQVVAGGSRAAYDTPGGGTYSVRVCSIYQAQSPPDLQYSGMIGTGPAGVSALSGPAQPQPAVGGVLGAQTTLGPRASGHAAILTRSGLAWFRLSTAANDRMTLRIFDPMHHVTRVVKGLTATYTGSTLRVTGHGLRLVVNNGARHRIAFTSSAFKASGKVVRGGFQIVA